MKDKTKKELKSWVIFLIVIGTLWITGLHRPLIAQVNRVVLWTGIIQPNTKIITSDIKVTALNLLDEKGQIVDFSRLSDKVVYTFPIYTLASQLPPDLEADVLPTTYVLDQKGSIKMKHDGMAKYDSDSFKKYLNDLVK